MTIFDNVLVFAVTSVEVHSFQELAGRINRRQTLQRLRTPCLFAT